MQLQHYATFPTCVNFRHPPVEFEMLADPMHLIIDKYCDYQLFVVLLIRTFWSLSKADHVLPFCCQLRRAAVQGLVGKGTIVSKFSNDYQDLYSVWTWISMYAMVSNIYNHYAYSCCFCFPAFQDVRRVCALVA